MINLIGLAAGMAICLLLALYIQNELGYDLYQERGDRIYRLDLERKYPNRSAFFSSIPPSIGQAARKEFPEVLESTRLVVFDDGQNGRGVMMAVGEKVFTEKKAVLMVDSNFFRVFTGHLPLNSFPHFGQIRKPRRGRYSFAADFTLYVLPRPSRTSWTS